MIYTEVEERCKR